MPVEFAPFLRSKCPFFLVEVDADFWTSEVSFKVGNIDLGMFPGAGFSNPR